MTVSPEQKEAPAVHDKPLRSSTNNAAFTLIVLSPGQRLFWVVPSFALCDPCPAPQTGAGCENPNQESAGRYGDPQGRCLHLAGGLLPVSHPCGSPPACFQLSLFAAGGSTIPQGGTMKKTTYSDAASEHAERAYTLILSGVANCKSAEDQLLLLQSLVCQCAVFTRMLSGDEAFFALLEQIRHADIEMEDMVLPQQIH
ncbi:hypothetical protein [Stutzerimonas stutzeri]|uniref:hypothetical protein n=1 Tax=Stutzerimonas stutzeri TaxID=316 RepID=UPI0034D3E0F8